MAELPSARLLDANSVLSLPASKVHAPAHEPELGSSRVCWGHSGKSSTEGPDGGGLSLDARLRAALEAGEAALLAERARVADLDGQVSLMTLIGARSLTQDTCDDPAAVPGVPFSATASIVTCKPCGTRRAGLLLVF